MSTEMSTGIPPEEIGRCERCDIEFMCRNLGQRFCCNGHGNPKATADSPHTDDCQRRGTINFSKRPQRSFTLESKPGEILWWMESNSSGNPNNISLGAAALSYKGAMLNYKAAEKVARYTKVLAFLTGVLAIATALQAYLLLFPGK